MRTIDIWSKGEVAGHIFALIKSGQVRDCSRLEIDRDYLNAFYPKCAEEWASRVPAENVMLDESAYDAPSSYYWPQCPSGCPKYAKSANMAVSLAGDATGSPPEVVQSHSVSSEEKGALSQELEIPTKVTIPWLLRHVPVGLWIAGGGLLIAAFVGGVKASSLTIVKEIFGLK